MICSHCTKEVTGESLDKIDGSIQIHFYSLPSCQTIYFHHDCWTEVSGKVLSHSWRQNYQIDNFCDFCHKEILGLHYVSILQPYMQIQFHYGCWKIISNL